MRKLFSILVATFAFLLSSCTDSENNPSINPQSDRISFVDKDAFEAYLASNTSETSGYFSSAVANPTSVIEQFKAYTAIGKLLNEELEFQIGNTIYKYCESGMGVFEIESSKYDDLQYYYKKESEIIENIKNFEVLSPHKYQITDGLIFEYTGEPVIVVQGITTPVPTRMSQDGLAKVQTSFWKSRSVISSSCGVKVEAWSRENSLQDFQAANTDLLLDWNIQVRAEYGIPTFRSSRGNLTGKGNIINQTIFSINDYENFTLWTNSTITGSAKYKGSWLTSEVTK